ncbi:hypothetical protein AB0A95_18400 [Micromonospora sp. NPDC049230]|uniref:hypothetical protein n=1 Tax=Micromonospora sp. NPDC049230 TaxID=3155502 RepID=UPI0033C7D768
MARTTNAYVVGGSIAGLLTMSVFRPILELCIRRRIAALPGVRFVTGAVVEHLMATGDGKRVTGPRFRGQTGRSEPGDADLVVDASGRGTRSPRWLADFGYPVVPVEELEVDVTYLSRTYRRDDQDLGGRIGTIEPGRPGLPHYGGTVPAEEDNRCTLMIAGVAGATLTSDDSGLLAVADRLTSGGPSHLIRPGVPLGPAHLNRIRPIAGTVSTSSVTFRKGSSWWVAPSARSIRCTAKASEAPTETSAGGVDDGLVAVQLVCRVGQMEQRTNLERELCGSEVVGQVTGGLRLRDEVGQ